MHSPVQYTKYHPSEKAINKTAPLFPSSRIQQHFQATTYPFHQPRYMHSRMHSTSLIFSEIVFRKRQLRSHRFPTNEYPNSWDSWLLREMNRNTTQHSFHLLKKKATHQPKPLPFLNSFSLGLTLTPFNPLSIVMNTTSARNYEIGEMIGKGYRVKHYHQT